MTVWGAVRRATLLIPSGPAHDPSRKHLFIVLNNPFPDATQADKVLVVSVSSIPESNLYDASCTLFPSEHLFIVKHSYVAFNTLALVDPGDLEQKVKAGTFIAKPMLDEKFFAYVLVGLKDSPFVEPRFIRYFEAAVQIEVDAIAQARAEANPPEVGKLDCE